MPSISPLIFLALNIEFTKTELPSVYLRNARISCSDNVDKYLPDIVFCKKFSKSSFFFPLSSESICVTVFPLSNILWIS